ncbi:MAG: ATP-binding protein [Oscillospiraceae bacterium]|nr:ATP-binding protein [Oscillospiraceae bacterium]
MLTHLGKTDAANDLVEKSNMYASLIARAERENVDRGGAASKQEAEYYFQAMDICDEIKNRYRSQPGLVAKWEMNFRYCKDRAEEILVALGAKPVQKAGAPKQSAPTASAPATPAASAPKKAPLTQSNNGAEGGRTETKTGTGFVTKNACKDVAADTIESWYKSKPNHGLEDLAGMDDLVDKLMIVAGDLGLVETDKILKIAPEKGICLYGFHGNGKTYTIEAFANYMMNKYESKGKEMKFLRLAGSDIHASLVGVAEKTLAIAFQEAIDNAPAILFFDEFDNICVSRTDAGQGHERRLTNAFLESYNNLVREGVPVVVMSATNNPWLVDSAAMNRFTTKILVPLPCEQSRRDFVARRFKNVKMDGITPEEIAADTDNFDFRDLGHLCDGLSGKLKQTVKKEFFREDSTDEENDRRMTEALEAGAIRLTREMYEEMRPMYYYSVTAEERKQLDDYAENLKKQV